MPADTLVQPTVFKEATYRVQNLVPVGSTLTSDEWSHVPVALRQRAMFSARIEDARFLQEARDLMLDWLKAARVEAPDGSGETMLAEGARGGFVTAMREFAVARGMGPIDGPVGSGGITDITSNARLRLIFDTNVRAAQEYGRFYQTTSPEVLNAFPAQRFVRLEERKEPRPLHVANEGEARRRDDIDFWKAMNAREIGGFEVPWGPWGFWSGMDVQLIPRKEAEALGIMKPGDVLNIPAADFNENLAASVEGLDSDIQAQLKAAFGDQVQFTANGTAKWKGTLAQRPRRAWKKAAPAPDPTPAPAITPPEEEAPPPPPAEPRFATPDDVVFVKRLGGSTGAELVKDKVTGDLYVRKRGASPDHVRAEVAADDIYRAAGARVPEARLFETPEGPVKLARFVEGETLGSWWKKANPEQREVLRARLAEHVHVDAWLGNWDVLGMEQDNVLVDAAGNPWRIDNGGSLHFRAVGSQKTDIEMRPVVGELWTMRGKGFTLTTTPGKTAWGSDNPPTGAGAHSAAMFGPVSIFDIAASVEATDWNAVLEKVPAAQRARFEQRALGLRSFAQKALDMRHSKWKASYTDDLLQDMALMTDLGIVDRLPLRMENKGAKHGLVLYDEKGRAWDMMRVGAGTAPTAPKGAAAQPQVPMADPKDIYDTPTLQLKALEADILKVVKHYQTHKDDAAKGGPGYKPEVVKLAGELVTKMLEVTMDPANDSLPADHPVSVWKKNHQSKFITTAVYLGTPPGQKPATTKPQPNWAVGEIQWKWLAGIKPDAVFPKPTPAAAPAPAAPPPAPTHRAMSWTRPGGSPLDAYREAGLMQWVYRYLELRGTPNLSDACIDANKGFRGQAGNSWSGSALVQKLIWRDRMDLPASSLFWWGNEKKALDSGTRVLTKMERRQEPVLQAIHAAAQLVLQHVDLPGNDRARSAFRTVRTEHATNVLRKNGIDGPRADVDFPRGMNESTSSWKATYVHGNTLTTFATPHDRMTMLIYFTAISQYEGSVVDAPFAGDGENESTVILPGIPVRVHKLDGHETLQQAGLPDYAEPDATTWQVPTHHLRPRGAGAPPPPSP